MEEGGKSLRIVTQGLGTLLIQPSTATAHDLERAALVIYPHRISAAQLAVAVEWAAASQCPIFCHEKDIDKMVKQGFGAYRFHGISGYREIAFQSGTLDLFPAKRERASGIKGRFLEFSETFGFLRAPSFHVMIHSRGEASILYLSSPNVDAVEWKVLSRRHPAKIVGAAQYSPEVWRDFGKRHNVTVIPARGLSEISTHANAEVEVERSNAWVESSPS